MMRVLFALVLALGACPVPASASTAVLPGEAGGQRMAAARDAVLPYVVSILVVREQHENGRGVLSVGSGSGTVVGADGRVVTNAHVTRHGRNFRVIFGDGREREADLVGEDAASDLAVLRIRGREGERFPFATLANDLDLSAGDMVLAMGAPWGLSNSMSAGVVNHPNRLLVSLFDDEADYEDLLDEDTPTGRYYAWIQHDAAIAPGNSGGPLVDLRGRVIGVNTRGMVLGGDLAFAIPAPAVRAVLEQISTHGHVPRSSVGLRLRSLKGSGQGAGVLVNVVERAGPAAKAGVHPGDRLLAIAGQRVDAPQPVDVPAVQQRIAELPPGVPVALRLAGADGEREVMLVPEPVSGGEVERAVIDPLGITVQGLSDAQRDRLALAGPGGLVVTSLRPGGAAATARPPLTVGAVLLEADGYPVRTLADLLGRLAQSDGPMALAWRQGDESRLGLIQPAPQNRRRTPLPELPKPWAGVEVQPLPPSLAEAVGLPASGFRVSRVYPDGPGARAGLRVGDLLAALEDVPLEAPNDTRADIFDQRIREYPIGGTVTISGWRGGKARQWRVVLKQAPLGVDSLRMVELGQWRMQLRELGFHDRVARRLSPGQQGVLVMAVEPGGPAGLAHLEADDILLAVGDVPVTAPEDVAPALAEAAGRIPLQVLRGGDARVVFIDSRWMQEAQ